MKALEESYGPSIFECLDYALFKLTQEDSIINYYVTFTALANRVEGISATVLLSYFISGLKCDIQKDIIPLKPESLTKAFSFAKLYKENYLSVNKNTVTKSPFYPDISIALNSGRATNNAAMPTKAYTILANSI